jgi:hypothetical protein
MERVKVKVNPAKAIEEFERGACGLRDLVCFRQLVPRDISSCNPAIVLVRKHLTRYLGDSLRRRLRP